MKVAVKSIHQIEITSRCNLRCKYCTHPHLGRAKEDMSWEVFEQSLKQAKLLGGEQELNLAGIGESTLHPNFVAYVYRAREVMGPDVKLVLATNGLLITQQLAEELVASDIHIFVSAHRPERAKPAIDILRKIGLLKGVSFDPTVSATNWAGQIEWEVTAPNVGSPCPWVRNGRLMVLSDGRVTRCSFDSTADDILGTVFDNLTTMQTSPYRLCMSCHLNVG